VSGINIYIYFNYCILKYYRGPSWSWS